MPTGRYFGVCRGTARKHCRITYKPLNRRDWAACCFSHRILRHNFFYGSSLYSPLWSVTSHAREHFNDIEAIMISSSLRRRGFLFRSLNSVLDIPIFFAISVSVLQPLIAPCAQIFRMTVSLAASIGDGFSFDIILTSFLFHSVYIIH